MSSSADCFPLSCLEQVLLHCNLKGMEGIYSRSSEPGAVFYSTLAPASCFLYLCSVPFRLLLPDILMQNKMNKRQVKCIVL